VNSPLLPCPSKRPKLNQGFSLVELLIVIAVLAVVLGFAVPNMRQMVLNNRTKTAVNSLVNGLQMARSEAITRNKTITFCPSNEQGISCATSSDKMGMGYQYGALVMADNSVIYRTEPTPKNVTVNNEGSSKIDFQSSGVVNNIGTISVTGQGNIKRTICIGAFGQTHTKEGIGAEVKCP